MSGLFIIIVLTRTKLLIARSKEIRAVSISLNQVKPDIYRARCKLMD